MTDAEFSWALRLDPTAERWGIELRGILNGQRTQQVAHFGSAGDYVKALIFASRDMALAETRAIDVLRVVTESWQPVDYPDAARDLRMLDLLITFTPEAGMARSLDLLRSLNTRRTPSQDSGARRLKAAVLKAMATYFPVQRPPLDAFEEYVAQLEGNLDQLDFAVHAAARLRSLRRLDAADVRLGAIIDTAPSLLPALLSVFLPEGATGTSDLASVIALYRHSLRASQAVDATATLRAAAGDHGIQIYDDPEASASLAINDMGPTEPIRLWDADGGQYYDVDGVLCYTEGEVRRSASMDARALDLTTKTREKAATEEVLVPLAA